MNFDLYVITENISELGRGHLDVAKAAVAAGASAVQLRAKGNSSREVVSIARSIMVLKKDYDFLFFINDRLDVALAVRADGVHLGQSDISITDARRIAPPEMLIGVSATNYDEALKAEREGADYLGVGPIFPTPSKSDAAPPIGAEVLKYICSSVKIPVIAIGGIRGDNMDSIIEAGAAGVAVISAVTRAPNMRAAASNLVERIRKGR